MWSPNLSISHVRSSHMCPSVKTIFNLGVYLTSYGQFCILRKNCNF
jgi:hypothetical protein